MPQFLSGVDGANDFLVQNTSGGADVLKSGVCLLAPFGQTVAAVFGAAQATWDLVLVKQTGVVRSAQGRVVAEGGCPMLHH